MKNIKIGFRISLIIIAFTALVACSKDTANKQSILDNPSIQKLPASAMAFLTWDSTRPAYQKFRLSQWGRAGNSALLDTFKQIAERSQDEKLLGLVDAFIKTGLITTSSDQSEALRDAVVFLTTDQPSHQPGITLYASANQGTNFKDKLRVLEDLMKSSGYETSKRTSPYDGFTLKIVRAQGSPISLHFAASQDILAVSSQEELLAAAFAEPNPAGLQQVKQTEAFLKTAGAANPGDEVSMVFVDLRKLMGEVNNSVPPVTGTAESQKIHETLANFPAQGLSWSRRMGRTLTDSIAISLDPKTEDQRRWVNALSGSGQAYSFKKLPPDILTGVTFDGALLHNIKEAALAEVTAEERSQLSPQLAFLDTLESFSVAIRSGTGGSPFPELVLVATGSNVDSIKQSFRNGVDQIVQALGLKLGAWQKKQIDKAQIEYIMSPLGIGAFLAQSSGTTILSSSESAVSDIMRAQAGTAPGLGDKLPDGAQDLLKQSNPLGFGYINFFRIASVLENVQGSLAMFTGGKSAVEQEKVEYLKNLGALAGSASTKDGILRLEASYDPGTSGATP
ncbi:MAG: hypothetical protein K1X79_08210 [Oligoflexia bacterium]|nr:hypothetical protein [Oligoflexia bacterium]